MIRAVAFDLDGTLVQTELLKAISYARAAQELCPGSLSEEEVIEAFKSVVGRSRQEVAQVLMERFGLEDCCRMRMPEVHADTPWQAFVQVRLGIFDQMIEDPELLRSYKWPRAIALVDEVRGKGMKTALTTTSSRRRTKYILDVLGLADKFDAVATSDDVEHTKPDPEVYNLVSRELGVPPSEWLAIEDSLPGVQAALAAGMSCIAVTTQFTRESIHDACPLDPRWIVDDAAGLSETVSRMIEERASD